MTLLGRGASRLGRTSGERVLAFALASLGVATGALAVWLGRSLAREKRLLHEALRLRRMAMMDPLTGVANRRFFQQRLRQSLALAQRQELPVALVLVDLDAFKEVNDLHGHIAGDRVLRSVARELGSDKRAEDLVARYGGEEFALILEGTDAAGALARAERLRRRLHGLELCVGGRPIGVTASFGVAAFPDTSRPTAASLISDSDRALYVAKSTGRDRCVLAGIGARPQANFAAAKDVSVRSDGKLQLEAEGEV